MDPAATQTPAAVLWDIDGTLLTSGGVAARAFLEAVEQVTGRAPIPDGIEFGGRIDPEIAQLLLETIEHDVSHVPAALAHYHDLMRERTEALNSRTRALPGVQALVSELAQAQVRQTVVTGNIRSVAAMKLAAAGLVPPIDVEAGGYGDSGATRADVAAAGLQSLFGAEWRSRAAECWIIGDTPRDLACARAVGTRCALVATGRTPMDALVGLGADVVLSGLETSEDLRRFWG
ncbi:HAD family hydrolase [Kineosporia babensis]|uniref:Haloacid dehalogenase-like hydrolase n=1 Tax=Kineosporia babensis TaxID=499548 RepID=A0A9X1SSC4_9ACTN|nr:haloacid dehalogenase-like hydrolase [Kineosporia babensis]MCD5310512.1 haloacid dehalogenase-like hydrolase [Kineosporia babensis]